MPRDNGLLREDRRSLSQPVPQPWQKVITWRSDAFKLGQQACREPDMVTASLQLAVHVNHDPLRLSRSVVTALFFQAQRPSLVVISPLRRQSSPTCSDALDGWPSRLQLRLRFSLLALLLS
jgi:hypothetical protein